jgi:DNA-binding CsgD family transcriptional regulator
MQQNTSVLTAQQRKTLQLIADGCSNEETAQRMGVAERAIEQRLVRIRARLGASTRAHMIAEAMRKGIIK